jgi:hypothetical protein
MKLIWDQIEGWFSTADKDFVTDILKNIRNGTVVEIGLFYGRSSAVMMPLALNNGNQYYAIDNFFGGIDPNTEASKVQRINGEKVKAKFISNMKALGINRSDYALYKSNSVEASIYLPDESVDFCFIDGDHAYESVKKDIEVWWKKNKKNGILAGHDFQNKDVSMAVVEFAASNSLDIENGGNCWAIRKFQIA